MREIARIQIVGDTRAFEDYWNAHFTPEIEYGIVAIYKDDPAFGQLREVISRFARDHGMGWREHDDAEYTHEELCAYDLLKLNISGDAGEGGNELADVYAIEPECAACGRVNYRQVRNLVLDFSAVNEDPFETGYFEHDLCQTTFGELVVSKRVKDLLEAHRVPDIALRATDPNPSSHGTRLAYYQLIVTQDIVPFVEPSRIQRLELCPACGRYREVLLDALPGTKASEFYFPASSYRGSWMLKTESLGRGPRYYPCLIIRRELYELFVRGGMTGFWAQPAHLV